MSNFKHTTLDGKLAGRWESEKAGNLGCKKLQVETNSNDGCGIMNESICCEGLASMMKLTRRNWGVSVGYYCSNNNKHANKLAS